MLHSAHNTQEIMLGNGVAMETGWLGDRVVGGQGGWKTGWLGDWEMGWLGKGVVG